jgi:hypothetical protein
MPVDCSPGVSQQSADINLLNLKLLYDDTASDISANRKSLFRHQDAWETLRLRNAQFAASFDHALLAGVAIANQVESTSDEQTSSPIRTGAGDNIAAGATPANRVVDETGAVAAGAVNSATAQATLGNVTAQLATLTTQVTILSESLAAFLAQSISNAGNAAKPTTATGAAS